MAHGGEWNEHNKMIKMYVWLNRLEEDSLWKKSMISKKKKTLDAYYEI